VSSLNFLDVSRVLKRKVQARLISLFQEEMQIMQNTPEHKGLDPAHQMLANSECTDWFQFWFDRLPVNTFGTYLSDEFEDVPSSTPSAGVVVGNPSAGSLYQYFDSKSGMPHYVEVPGEMKVFRDYNENKTH